ncbi:MAG: hypothetical protein HUK02_09020, partial [Bacteroidaceae bacterium]|nr:hypothetical protein [Bacteroidaceae bacterium]
MPARIERLFWMVALMLTTMTARADGSFSDFTGTTVEQRLGHGRDSVANRNFFNQYVQAYQRQDWKSCYRPWRELMTRAPFSTYNVTNYAATVHLLLQQLMLSEPDSVERYLYFKDAMEVFDFELQHYRSLNTITDQKHEPLVPGVIQCRRAYYYKELGQHIPAVAYKKETAYKNFVEAFATLRNEQLTMGEEIEAFYLSHYFQACQALFETDRERYYEQFLTDYITCLETCDNMMEKYAKVDEQKWQEYAAARNDIQVYFGRTGAGSPEGLMAYYEPRLTTNGKNQRFLDNAVHLMFYNGCIATDVFYDACERAYLLKPNYENCIGMGLFGMDPTHNNGRIDSLSLVDAKRYFDEARRLARNANEHYLASKFTADALARTPQP